MGARAALENDPLWYKDAVIYQLHVKAFYDSDGDGIGDFKGLTRKLDYLKNLGITAVWLLPFYPSPLRDDGYDISDYYNVHAQYGTLKDFKEFLREAHARGLRVITELVINHTSDQHPWFARARRSQPGSAFRDYYVWSDNQNKYRDARIIFNDFETSNWTWDETAQAYYWHRFYSHQPDLNFDNPMVQREIFRMADFWFSMGIDGLRLDAVPYLFEREGTNCENLPETHAFLKKLRRHVDAKFKNRMLLAEANQWPEDAAAYFGKGDQCHMAFHFPLMPRMYMSIQMEDRFPVIDILEQTPDISKKSQWAIFLRNHDELTLEMVTDEERDYMYRAYAKDARSRINLGIRRRLVPLLGNNRRKIELMNVLLLSLPGTPIIYYGDEIGMGDNHFLGDRDGVRTPMQWSSDRNAGFSKANPQRVYLPVIIDSEYHYAAVNVETQDGNLSSLLWWTKRVVAMRKKYKSFSRGDITFLLPENQKVLCFLRSYKDERMLVIINLSRFCQSVELDLKEYIGCVPEEVFSQNEFPVIRDAPYPLTLGPHNHFWFLLKKKDILAHPPSMSKRTTFLFERSWEELFHDKNQKKFETAVLPLFLNRAEWFAGKGRVIKDVTIKHAVTLANYLEHIRITIVQVSYTSGNPESYLLPLAFAFTNDQKDILQDNPQSILCHFKIGKQNGYIYDGVCDEHLHRVLFEIIAQRKKISLTQGKIVGIRGKKFSTLLGKRQLPLRTCVLKGTRANTAVLYENAFFLKIFRKLDDGKNPDTEAVRFLCEHKKSGNSPSFAGSIDFQRKRGEPFPLCLLESYVPHQTDGWNFTLDHLSSYFELVLSRVKEIQGKGDSHKMPPDPSRPEVDYRRFIDGFYLEMIRILGQRTAEMHLNLGSGSKDLGFDTESFSLLYQRSVLQSMGSQARRVFKTLKDNLAKLPADIQAEAAPVLENEQAVYKHLKRIAKTKFSAKKIRIHGDYHLGQVLFTGKDFVIIDFEGESSRPFSERRIKRSPIRDAAGMVRSLHYATFAVLFLNKGVRSEDVRILERSAQAWFEYVSGAFIQSYLETISSGDFLPKKKKEFDLMMSVYLLDKAVYELGYELNNRPEWVMIPLRGIRFVLDHL